MASHNFCHTILFLWLQLEMRNITINLIARLYASSQHSEESFEVINLDLSAF